MRNILLPFILTTFAGLSTVIGYFIIFLKSDNYENIVYNSFSFTAGVMLSISFFDLIPEGFNLLHDNMTYYLSLISSILSISLGITISFILEKSMYCEKRKFYKIGIFSMITIILHNIPEGIITFITSKNDINLGIPLALSIAIHNIPEGVSISLPLYYSLYSKKITFLYTLLSGLSEPFGAIIALLFIKYFNNNFLGVLFNIVAGFMIFLSCNDLKEVINNNYNKKKNIIYFLFGIIVSLLNFML